jgi:hypothetical protein
LKQDDDTNQELSDDESDDHGESTLLREIVGNDLDHLQEVLLQGQAGWDMSL